MADKQVKFVLAADDRASAAINGLRGTLGRLQGAAGGVAASMGAIGLAAGGVTAAAAAFAAFVRSTVDGVDRLNDLKAASGASIENLSALEDIGARTGTSFDTVGSALLRFNKLLSEAKPGSATENTLQRLGLSARELKQLDPAEAFRRTAVALQGFADDGDRARIVQELFGKSTREVAKFLQDLGKQTELVAKLTTEQADAAEKFNNQLSVLQKNAQDASRALVAELLPGLNSVLERFTKAKQEGTLFADTLRLIAQALPAVNPLGFAGGLVDRTRNLFGADELQRLEGQAQRLRKLQAENNPRKSAAQRLDEARALEQVEARIAQLQATGLPRAQAQAAEFARLAAAGGAAFAGDKPRLGGAASGGGAKTRAEQIGEEERALATYVQQQQRELDQTRRLSEEQQALNFLKTLGTTGEIPQVRELVLGLAAQNDALEEQAGWRKLNNELSAEEGRRQQELDAALDSFSGRVDQARKQAQTQRLEQRLAAGEQFSPEELERAVKGIAGIQEETVRLRTAAEEVGGAFKSSFEEAIISGRGFFTALRQQILSIALRRGITDPIGNLLGGAVTAAFGSIFGGFFAQGGMLGAGKIGIAGEAGPELILGPAQVVPQGAAGGGKTVYDLSIGTVNAGGGVSRGEVAAIVRQALADQQRRFNRLQTQGAWS